MKIAIVTFEGFNEIDSFVALSILNRVKIDGWKAEITSPTPTVTSLNGITIQAQRPLSFANEADVVLFGSGSKTRQVVQDDKMLAILQLDPTRQLVGSQCSGSLVMKKLGLVENIPVCVDATTRPFLLETGATVLDDRSFYAEGNVATAGGCLSSVYLAAWVILNTAGYEAAAYALGYVAPVGEEQEFVERAMRAVGYESGNFVAENRLQTLAN